VVERAPPVDIENALREAGSVVINAGATPQD
jgi:hypothetical protein